MKPVPKYKRSSPIPYWPAPHINEALRLEKKRTGKPMTLLIDESMADRYGLPIDPSAMSSVKYPKHRSDSQTMNDKEAI